MKRRGRGEKSPQLLPWERVLKCRCDTHIPNLYGAMLKRLLVLLACLIPHLVVAAPKGFPEEFQLTSLGISLTWECDDSGCGYEGTYEVGDWFYTLFFEVGDDEDSRLWVNGEDAWGNTSCFRYLAVGDEADGFYLYEEEFGYPFSDITDPFSEYDFLEPVPSGF